MRDCDRSLLEVPAPSETGEYVELQSDKPRFPLHGVVLSPGQGGLLQSTQCAGKNLRSVTAFGSIEIDCRGPALHPGACPSQREVTMRIFLLADNSPKIIKKRAYISADRLVFFEVPKFS